MDPHVITLNLCFVLALAMLAQWMAWTTRLPSILLLLITGLVVGPGLKVAGVGWFLSPDALLGPLLEPLVSLAVGLILYEGGLSLRMSEIKAVGGAVRNLVSLGAVITWLLAALAARWLLGLSWSLSLVLGALLSVTGPTVVGPLLRMIRPQGHVGSVLKWEGIVIDPVGATLAVLVFETVHGRATVAGAAAAFGITAAAGVALGALGALVMVVLIRKRWLPDPLHNPASLAVVALAFGLAEEVHHEAGLVATTAMGWFLANQRWVQIQHLVAFKETLRLLALSMLFILLAANLEPRYLHATLDVWAWAFVAVLILVIRPLTVLGSTLGSSLTWRERAFMAWLAPRGIVAAAVASQFALRLQADAEPDPQAQALVAITFLVIVATVTVYGLTAGPLAYRLGIARPDPQGLLLVGAHPWAREVARLLKEHEIPCRLVDNNRAHVAQTRLQGLDAVHANALSEYVHERLDLGAMGRLLALTPNDEANTLAAERFVETFGRENVYQLPPSSGGSARHEIRHESRVQLLFGPNETYARLSERFDEGQVLKATRLTAEFDFPKFCEHYGESALPLFLITGPGRLQVFGTEVRPAPTAQQTLIALVTPPPEAPPVPPPGA